MCPQRGVLTCPTYSTQLTQLTDLRYSISLGCELRHAQQFLDRRLPLQGFKDPVLKHGAHSFFAREPQIFRRARAAQNRIMKTFINDHQLENPEAALVAALIALRTASALPEP